MTFGTFPRGLLLVRSVHQFPTRVHSVEQNVVKAEATDSLTVIIFTRSANLI